MRKMLMPLLAAAITTAVMAGLASGGMHAFRDDGSNHKNFEYAIGLWGDLPYSSTQASTGVPNLIDDMNAQDLEFTAHDGDLKQGSNSPCDDALYTDSLARFNSLEAPAIFTPGDNDWTDCDRSNNGGYNSLERLSYERKVLFGTKYSLGQHKLRQDVQSTPLCQGWDKVQAKKISEACVENRRWSVKGVMYATINIQGSCNNLCDTNPDADEYAARNAADIAWLHETFEKAKDKGSAAVMLITQADPGWDLTDGTRAPLRNAATLAELSAGTGACPPTTSTAASVDGYQSFLTALRDEVVDFGRPVAYVHGDSHYFRIDKPLLNSSCQRLENFTRVETFGDNQGNGNNDVHWLKVLVDPNSREVFAYQPQIVPDNRVAVPAPSPLQDGHGGGHEN